MEDAGCWAIFLSTTWLGQTVKMRRSPGIFPVGHTTIARVFLNRLDAGDDAAAIQASLAEKIARFLGDEVDQYTAFAKLIREGKTAQDFAFSFGLTAPVWCCSGWPWDICTGRSYSAPLSPPIPEVRIISWERMGLTPRR